MQRAEVEVTNPYWDEVVPYVKECQWSWGRGHYEVGGPLRDLGSLDAEGNEPIGVDKSWIDIFQKRYDLVSRYSWTIPDPGTLLFMDAFSTGRMVDPMAGTGYWAYLLGQMNIDVTCYDINPGDNHWHKGYPLHMPVEKMDGVEAVKLHPDRALLLAWPPCGSPDGRDVLKAYEGDRVVFIGESQGGCTGSDGLYDLLESDWDLVAEHRPVQWFGVHDEVSVYDRRR